MSSSIVCLIGDAPNHLALVHAINQKFGVKGLVIDTKKSVLKRYARPFCLKLKEKFLFGKINKAWHSMQKFYSHSTREIEVEKVLRVNSINDPQVISFLQDTKPDLIVVSGTSIIKEPLVSFPLRVGMLNLHTGLSPYVKGGPNCTNWCIANNEWEYIGNTIMWLSRGIDSGNIIASETVDVFDEMDLAQIQIAVMKHAHDLYIRAIEYVVISSEPWQSVPQSEFGPGRLFQTYMWNDEQKRWLLKNLKKRRMNREKAPVQCVSLPNLK